MLIILYTLIIVILVYYSIIHVNNGLIGINKFLTWLFEIVCTIKYT